MPSLNLKGFYFAIIVICSPIWLQAADGGLSDAKRLFLQGDFSAAIQNYRAIIKQAGESEEASLGLIRALWKKDDIKEAYESGQRALGIFPASAAIHAAMGDVLFRMAQMPEAREAYQKSIKLDPNSARGYFGFAKLHSFNFNRKSARSMDLRAYECDPEDPEIILAYATDLPAAEQIPLLEKYLLLAVNETEDKRHGVADLIAYLKKVGDLKTWELRDPPLEGQIKLDPVTPSPRTGQTGYRIAVILNGSKKVNLQFDTGADGILIHRKIVEKLNLEFFSPGHIRGIGESGLQKANMALAQSVKIGSLEFHNCPLTITEKKLTLDIDGIIGADVFRQFLLKLDFPKNRLEIVPLPPINGKSYDDPESWKDLDRAVPSELAGFALMGRCGNLVIPTVVNKKKGAFFFLDTGAAVNIVSRDLAQQVTSLRDVGKVIRGLSGTTQTYIANNISLQIGRLYQENEGMYAIDLKDMSHKLGLEISGLIGYPMLKLLTITIDFRDGLINFEYPFGPAAKQKASE